MILFAAFCKKDILLHAKYVCKGKVGAKLECKFKVALNVL